MLCPYDTDKMTDSSLAWHHSVSGQTGPVAVLIAKNGSEGSQAVTWERMVVEAFY
jgi:2-methylcitrate dehydratase PrpD